MRKTTTLLSVLFACPALTIAQDNNGEKPEVFHKEYATSFYKTVPIRDILDEIPTLPEDYFKDTKSKDHKQARYADLPELNDWGIPENGGIDPALQTAAATRKESWIKAQWTGLNGSFPPDPTGAAGIDHYVQAVNSSYRVFDKDGNPVTGVLALNSLLGSPDGDPIVMYDRYADRWFISDFRVSTNGIHIAVSETSDPLGAYFVWTYTYSNFPDYPKFSVWSHSYFMTINSGTQDCSAFERDKMLTGDASAAVVKMNFPAYTQFFNSAGLAYAEGATEPDMDESGYFFAVQEDAWSGSITDDNIKIMKADIDWSLGTGSVYNHQSLNTASFNCVFTPSWDDLTQKGTAQKLDAVAGIFMYKVQYRRFPGYNTVVLCNTVDMGSNRAGIRWYELRDNDDGNWYIYQQSTWSPDATNNRWMGSIAMDAQGSIALAYCFTGTNDFPGIRYTGRFYNDPIDQMTVIEQVAKDGTGSQTGGNRWGDYSQMTMDPTDDMTFWFTGEWMASGSSRKTEIFSFSTWNLTGTEESKVKPLPYFNAYQPDANQLTISWRDLADANPDLSVYDMNGKIIHTQQLDGNTGEITVDLPGNASGIYVARLNGEKTDLSNKIYIAQ